MTDPSARYGLSKQQLLRNAAKVAQAKAQMTKKAEDWDAAQEAWSLVDDNNAEQMEDYCRRMAKMIRELAAGK